MKISAKVTRTIAAAAIFAMLVVPAMANTTTHGSFLAANGLGTGNDPVDTLLLARGGNGNGGGGKGSGGGSGDRDRDRDRDGSCLDSVTAANDTPFIILAGNGNGSSDQDQDKDQDQDRDASCQV